MISISPSIKAAQGSMNDNQHDFYDLVTGVNVPPAQEPDQMYDLKRLSYDANGAINLTVWGTLDVNDGNMTNDPFYVFFNYQNEIHGIQIGTGRDTDNNETRAYLMKMSETEEQYWNGSDWVDQSEFQDASEDDWDLCLSRPNGTSKIIMDIPGATGIVLANAQFSGTFMNPFPPQVPLQYGAMSLIIIEDFIVDTITFPFIDPLLLLLLSQTSEPSAIPGYPSVILISIAIILISLVIVHKKRHLSLL
jgi:hypothetical protein